MSKFTLEEVDMNDVRDDILKAVYMLHYLKKYQFSRSEIREVAFSLTVVVNTIEKQIEESKHKSV